MNKEVMRIVKRGEEEKEINRNIVSNSNVSLPALSQCFLCKNIPLYNSY